MGTDATNFDKSGKNEQPEEKIVNLFEDMNPHEHNEESYQKMIKEQEANKTASAIRSGNCSDPNVWQK